MARNKAVQDLYYQKNREHLKERSRARYAANKEAHAKAGKAWGEKNKESRRAYYREYFKERKKDPTFRAMHNARKRANSFLKGFKNRKSGKLGCDRETFKKHLEDRFQPGMSWENYGEWEIDHIIGLSTVNSAEEIEKLCHYTNLQPLWKSDNIRKR